MFGLRPVFDERTGKYRHPETGQFLSQEDIEEMGCFLAICGICGKQFPTLKDGGGYLEEPRRFYCSSNCYPVQE